jgi:hypothetical protein
MRQKLILFYKKKIILFGGANVPLKGIIPFDNYLKSNGWYILF